MGSKVWGWAKTMGNYDNLLVIFTNSWDKQRESLLNMGFLMGFVRQYLLSFHSLMLLGAALAAFFFLVSPLYAANQPFANWVIDFKREAMAEGISKSLLDKAFQGITPNARIIELDRKQPEGTMTLEQYLTRVVNDRRVREGRRLMAQHRTLLHKVSEKYGVQPRFIVTLWGVETNFGSNTGGFSIVEALATLAHDGRRSSFFRKELMNAFKIMQAGHIAPEDMKGSWAGALGQCQFMPSSFLAFAE
ncbi:MAG: lytic murein transglycosylase, partial [Rickettsiales bacterium]